MVLRKVPRTHMWSYLQSTHRLRISRLWVRIPPGAHKYRRKTIFLFNPASLHYSSILPFEQTCYGVQCFLCSLCNTLGCRGDFPGNDDYYVANLPHVTLTSQPMTNPIKSDKAIAIPISHRPDDRFIIPMTCTTIKKANAIVSNRPKISTVMLRSIPARLVLPER